MAELTTLARPYAQAVFELANSQNKLADWSGTLNNLVEMMNQAEVAALADNVKVSKQQLTAVLTDLCGSQISDPGKNLLALLIENGRLVLLPEITAVYEVLRAEAEQTIEAEVITAFPMDKAQADKIATALKARLGREVKINATVDKSVLGGAIIRAGDMVIDGSVSGRLSKLDQAMN